MSARLLGVSALASVLALVVGCEEHFPSIATTAETPTGLRARPPNPTCVAPPPPPNRVRLEPWLSGFRSPLAMIERRAAGLAYVVEMGGTVLAIDRATGASAIALDLRGSVGGVPGFEDWALYSFALHPTKPYAYAVVERALDPTTNPALPYRAELVRFETRDGGRTFDRSSETLVLRVDRPGFNHSMGTALFGPDGYLYVAVGEGFAAYTPGFDAKGTLLGTIVRLDVDGAEPYAIPPTNPFAQGGGRLPEVYASGLRNPFRFTIDPVTGRLFAGDVGEATAEEINVVEPGRDYGWPSVEGDTCFLPRVGCEREGKTPPYFSYPSSTGGAVTGGYVYRGKRIPSLAGRYVFGDFVVGRIWALDESGARPRATLLNPGGPKPLLASFAEDEDGELYALDWGTGTIYRVVEGEADTREAMPSRLSETGCVDPIDARKPAAGLVPYGVNVELFSDDADKRRYVAIPDGRTIAVDEDGHLGLPEGSVLVKEFSLAGRRVETRLLVRHADGAWTGASYEWNDAQTDAVRLDDVKSKRLPSGQEWTFPSPTQCFVCHTKAAKIALGLETQQLNRAWSYGPGDTDNQLHKLGEIGYLDAKLDPGTAPRLPEIAGAAPIEERARGYLHANCSMCHRAGGPTPIAMDLRFSRPLAPFADPCRPVHIEGVEGVRLLSPGDPARSAIHIRMNALNGYKMPPIGRSTVDDRGSALVDAWIRTMPPCDPPTQ